MSAEQSTPSVPHLVERIERGFVRETPDPTARGVWLTESDWRIALRELAEQLQSAEDHIEGLCKELDSRAPGWENERPWYVRQKDTA